MASDEFFQKIKKYYQSSFDFIEPFNYEGREYTALAEFHSHIDKYVLLKKAQIWAADSHEFCIFQTYDSTFTEADFGEITRFLEGYMEPQLVRKGEENVPENHMYTYLSIVIVCNAGADKEAVKRAKKYTYTKYYNMYLRGYSEGRVILADVKEGRVYTNRAAHQMKKLYKRILK